MRHLLGSTALAAATFMAACFAMATTATADTIKVDRDTSATGYSGQYAGEFKVLTFSGGGYASMGAGVAVSGGLFQTFCLESNEDITINQNYNYTLASGAVHGGQSGGDPDPLDARTAYLFTKFWSGTLSNYNYTLSSNQRTTSADALQLAIWNIEGELVGNLLTAYNANTQAQNWVSEANTAVASGGSWFNVGLGSVRVINPTNADGVHAQSLLVLVPVPPALLSGLGLLAGLGCVGLMRRRSRQAIV